MRLKEEDKTSILETQYNSIRRKYVYARRKRKRMEDKYYMGLVVLKKGEM